MSDRKIFPTDVQALLYCNKGARIFFKQHGLNYAQFVSNGIDQQDLIDTNDAMALKVVERVQLEVDE